MRRRNALSAVFGTLKMACVTLKRPIDVLGSPHAVEHEPVSKRKRCGPSFFPTTPPGSSHRGDGYRGFSHYGSPMSSRVVKRVKRKLEVDEESGPSTTGTVSPFIHATPPLPTGTFIFMAMLPRTLQW